MHLAAQKVVDRTGGAELALRWGGDSHQQVESRAHRNDARAVRSPRGQRGYLKSLFAGCK